MVFVLFLIAISIAYYYFQYSRLRAMSPTFWASFMFAGWSFIYVLTYYDMKSDISPKTLLFIVSFFLVTALAEFLVNCTVHYSKQNSLNSAFGAASYPIVYIKKWKIILLTLVYLVVAAERFKNLSIYAAQYGNTGSFENIMSMLSTARLAYIKNNGAMELSNGLFNQLVYLSEITTYICLYIFIYNLLVKKKKHYYLLFPLVPDVILRLVSTSRTSFIMLIFSLVICFFAVTVRTNKLRRVKISPKILLLVSLFAVVFVVYGRVRNKAETIPLINYIQMYTCSSLYNLNSLIEEGWQPNPYFGYGTLDNIYNLLGITHDIEKQWATGMVTFSKSGVHSNVYTSLALPLKDYGYLGCLILRFLVALSSASLISRFLSLQKMNTSFFCMIYFIVVVLYCYMYSAVGDSFFSFFLNPALMIRYLIYGYFLVHFYLKPKYRY